MTTTTRDSYCVTAAGIAEGTSAAKYKTTYAISAVVNGRSAYKAATDDLSFTAFSGTTFTALAAKETCVFWHMMNASGTITHIQSAIVPSSAGTSYAAGAWEWPQRDAYACVGATVIRTDNSAVFTANTTDLGATDVVDTHYDATPGVYGTPIAY